MAGRAGGVVGSRLIGVAPPLYTDRTSMYPIGEVCKFGSVPEQGLFRSARFGRIADLSQGRRDHARTLSEVAMILLYGKKGRMEAVTGIRPVVHPRRLYITETLRDV